jgi:hypothetical protein
MTINIHPTYRDQGHLMREVSWIDRSGTFNWTVQAGAKQTARALRKLTAELGPITVVRHPQGNQWK